MKCGDIFIIICISTELYRYVIRIFMLVCIHNFTLAYLLYRNPSSAVIYILTAHLIVRFGFSLSCLCVEACLMTLKGWIKLSFPLSPCGCPLLKIYRKSAVSFSIETDGPVDSKWIYYAIFKNYVAPRHALG